MLRASFIGKQSSLHYDVHISILHTRDSYYMDHTGSDVQRANFKSQELPSFKSHHIGLHCQ